MMKQKISLLIITIILIHLMSVLSITTFAAEALNFNLEGSNSANPGKEYSLKISLTNISSAVPRGVSSLTMTLKFDNSKFTYDSANKASGVSDRFAANLHNNNQIIINYVDANNPLKKADLATIKFTCKSDAPLDSSASFTLQITSCDYFDENYNTIAVDTKPGSKTVKIEKSLSDNAYLKSLSIDVRDFQEAFSKTRYTYNVNIGYNYSSVKVTAIPEDSNAKVSISGGSNLVVGKNVVTITVTAQNSSTKVYTINIVRYPSPETPKPTPTPTKAPTEKPTTPAKTPTKAPTQTPTQAPTAPPTTDPAQETVPPDSPGNTAQPGTENPDSTASPDVTVPVSTEEPTDEPTEEPTSGINNPGGDDSWLSGEITVFGKVYKARTVFAASIIMAIIAGIAIGSVFGYYVGRRKNFKSRFKYY